MKKQLLIVGIIVLLVAVGLSGCNEQKQDNDEKNIIKFEPIAESSSSINNGVYPLTVEFTGSATDSDGTIVSYYWDFGDRSNSSEQNPKHTFQTYGEYIVKLTVTDNDGLTDNDTVSIDVLLTNPPIASVSSDKTSGGCPLTIQFTGSATDSDGTIVSYYWDFGDGSNSTEQNPLHTFTSAGTYKVKLTVTDDDGATGLNYLTITAKFPDPQVVDYTAYRGYGASSSSILTVNGVIKNVANVPIKFIRIIITFYDSAGNVIKTNENTVWSEYFHEYQIVYPYATPYTIYPAERGIFSDTILDIPYYDHYDVKIVDYDKTSGETPVRDIIIENVIEEKTTYSYSLDFDIKNVGSKVIDTFGAYLLLYNSQGNLVATSSDTVGSDGGLYVGETETVHFYYGSTEIDVNEIFSYDYFMG